MDDGVDGGFRPVFTDESGEGGEKAVWMGLSVDSADDIAPMQSGYGNDFRGEFFAQKALYEQHPEVGAAALVAQHVAGGGDLLHDFFPVEKAAACAGSQNGDEAATCSAKNVTGS